MKNALKDYWQNVKEEYRKGELKISDEYFLIIVLFITLFSFGKLNTYLKESRIQEQKQEIETLRRQYEQFKNS
jgi:hypothetical protein